MTLLLAISIANPTDTVIINFLPLSISIANSTDTVIINSQGDGGLASLSAAKQVFDRVRA